MKNPKVSVLIPVFNTQEEHLRMAIDSVLSQTYKDFEVIIVNNSPENANVNKVLKTYTDKRIKFFTNKKNMGISDTRNQMVDLATGEYLAVMDHDDISLPNRFEEEVKYLDAHPEVGVVSCWVKTYPVGKLWKYPVESSDIKVALMEKSLIAHSPAMIRKKVLTDNKIKYESAFSPAEDYALWCRLINLTEFHNIPEVLFHYRMHETNAHKVFSDKMEKATYAVRDFVQKQNPVLYQQYLSRITYKTVTNLFGFIPFLLTKKKGNCIKYYLFRVIPVFTSKTKSII